MTFLLTILGIGILVLIVGLTAISILLQSVTEFIKTLFGKD